MALKDTYFTISEAAKQLGVTRQTVSRWVAKGSVPTERIGRETLIKKQDLFKYFHRRFTLVAADNVIALYKATVEEYLREKGRLREDEQIEFVGPNEIVPRAIRYLGLTPEQRAEVANRARPIIEGFLKDHFENIVKVESPEESEEGGQTSNK